MDSQAVMDNYADALAEIRSLKNKVENLERVLKANRPDCPFYTTCTPSHRCPGCGGYDD